ncbi:MAG: hypothetical protein IJ370_07775 [Oscillospiraceae bacterium]|nr:hypothetical protein [Oscillospiraceae bacterium]
MKKYIKYGLIAFLILTVVSIIQVIIGINKVNDIDDFIVIYNEQEYEKLSDWVCPSQNYTEVSAFVGDADAKNKAPNKTVRLFETTYERFIEADVHGVEVLYHKKSDKLPSYLEIDNIEKIEASYDGKYAEMPLRMQKKLIGYLKERGDESIFSINEENYGEISKVYVTYKGYSPVEHCIGSIVKYQNNFGFVASEQDILSVLGDVDIIYIPFDPIEPKEQATPPYQNIDSISEIKLISVREEITIDRSHYKDFVEHIIKNRENSYTATTSGNLLGDIVVYYNDGTEEQKIGTLVYDDEGLLCFEDTSLPEFEDLRWVYPLPFDIRQPAE